MMLEMRALDTLFFRDSRPFTKGEDTWANGVFPPAPSVFYGALRSLYFSHHISELPKAQQGDDPTADLRIQGIYLKLWGHVCLPIPLDCVTLKDGGTGSSAFLLSLVDNHLISSCPTPYLLTQDGSATVEPVVNGFLDHFSLKDYLHLKTNKFSFRNLDDHLISEPKIGITRDRTTGSSRDAMLYRADMQRLQNVILAINYTGLDLPAKGLAKLGAESKAVAYWHSEKFTMDAPPLKGNRFKLYLATPAIFKRGWLPSWIVNRETLVGQYQGLQLRLLTAAVGPYISIGGFDIRKKQPKPMQRAVPAGSVYYFEILEGEPEKAVEVFHGRNISEDLAKQGFGLAYLGGVYS